MPVVFQSLKIEITICEKSDGESASPKEVKIYC